MKKLWVVLLTIGCSVSLMVTAWADVIVEPQDSFYETHRDQCAYIEEVAYGASSGQEVKVYASPLDNTVVATVPNGEKIQLAWQWESWYYNYDGWVHGDDISMSYGTEEFCQEHETTSVDQVAGFTAPVAEMYTYPNSGDSYTLEESPKYSTFGASMSQTYQDENGLEWGYIGYYMQWKGWICMDDPTNSQLDSGAVPMAESVSQLRGSDANPEEAVNYLLLASVAVGLVGLVTVFLLLGKKRK